MVDPIPEEFRQKMNALASALDELFNDPNRRGYEPRIGFVLLTDEFGQIDGGRVNYISNAIGRRCMPC